MSNRKPAPPQISPYVFPVLLAGFGLWCFYDGWLTTDPEMMKHQLFNRIASGVLLLWAAIDFVRTHKREKTEAIKAAQDTPEQPPTA
ncbi:hypothetical protein Despr_0979 [Desulfobulbus propionicus DSM 2032]|jgi:hypothetical protein|uniref:Uncharacterized protein n=1 Tax=Desulfobulbus propionicus (strain ATCC 33891 / DSM 2032 / VKM B-1956 / 1pr3) TaxID=577650 RepID=A0A7U3YKW1_DESPD|nr:hypothetical protein [Desulfobulbus propionicus]ADW17153.1 hypothetical protein Despr_0979 [Desulfobulbus propionicus DSM 2032]